MKISIIGNLEKCIECGRSILTERVLMGTNYTSKIVVRYWDCLSDNTKKEVRREEIETMERRVNKLFWLPVIMLFILGIGILYRGFQHFQSQLFGVSVCFLLIGLCSWGVAFIYIKAMDLLKKGGEK